jgi:hypothetical protein
MRLPIYTWNYIGDDALYRGPMAQDVLRLYPACVSVGTNGYYRVNHSLLGIPLERRENGKWTVVNTDTDQRYKESERRVDAELARRMK